MMKKQYLYSCLIFLATNFIIANLSAEELKKEEFVSIIEENFHVSDHADVNLSNRYGKLEIRTWNKSEVNIKVTITVKAKSKEIADAEFDRIKIHIEGSDDMVTAKTEICEKEKSSWWSGSSSYSSDFTIDYLVFMPTTIDLRAANKYGNMMVAQMDGPVVLIQKYGDFDIEGVNNDLIFDLGYGNGNIGFAHNAEGIIKYSKLNVNKCRDLNLESKYSKIKIDKADNIESTSKYDNFTLGEVLTFENIGKYDNIIIDEIEEIDVQTRYTTCNIDYLHRNGEFIFSYGGVKIENLKNDFEKLSLSGNYTSFKIYRENEFHVDFDVKGNYTDINLPANSKFIQNVKKGNNEHYSGNTGNDSSSRKIKAVLTYGSFKID